MAKDSLGVYYINKIAQANGDYFIHKFGCPDLNLVWPFRRYLGLFVHCDAALDEAKKIYSKTTTCCPHCCPDFCKKD
jgi:hypothetical protein